MKGLEKLAIGLMIAACFLQSPLRAESSQQFDSPSPEMAQALPLAPIALPDLPEYTGQAKLERAVGFPSTGQIERSVTLTYATKVPADTIIAWYRSALGLYQWTIENEDSNVLVATQNRTGNMCNIYCDEEGSEGCNLHISYSFRKQSDD